MSSDDATLPLPGDDETPRLETRRIAGRYALLVRIGSGGFGSIWKARDELLDRIVAIKILHAGRAMSGGSRERFLREARATARLQHENVVALYDAGEDGTDLYLVLEYVEGESLQQRLARDPLPPQEAVRAVQQIAAALDAAHAMGIVHRDIKPANVLLREDGRVKVADFGIARMASDGDLTREGTVVGTPRYMAPEQLEGARVGPAADLFALGCVAYEALTGSAAFGGASLTEVAGAILHGDRPRISPELCDDVPALCALIAQLLERDPAARPSSAADVVRILDGTRPTRRRVGRRVIAAAVAAVAMLVLALVFIRFREPRVVRTVETPSAARLVAVMTHRPVSMRDAQPAASRNGVRGYRAGGVFRIAKQNAEPATSSVGDVEFSLRTVSATSVEVRAARDDIDTAVQAIRLRDALPPRAFEQPNRIAGTGQASRVVRIDLDRVPPSRVLEMIAAAVGWQIVIDPTAKSGPVADFHVSAPWDDLVMSILERHQLSLLRLDRVWIVMSRQRRRELDERRAMSTISIPTTADLDAAARAMSAASSERGTVLVNRRVGYLIISELPEVLEKQRDILGVLEGERAPRRPPRPQSPRAYSGAPCDVHVRDADLREYLALVAQLTGVSFVVDPQVQGRVNLDLDGVPWDEMMEAALHVTRNWFELRGAIVEVLPESARPQEPIIVETVKLEREDPRFFEPWRKGLAPRGALLIDPAARMLVIRGPRTTVESFRNLAKKIDAEPSAAVRPLIARVADEAGRRGFAAAEALQREIARSVPFGEAEWNAVGYALLDQNKTAAAVAVLERNVRAHPQSSNAWDSLGEAAAAAGDKKRAIECYRRSLELDPTNTNARAMLAKLGAS